jgi:hypothetical protein
VSVVQAALNLAADLTEVRAVATETGWSVDGPSDLVIRVTMRSRVDAQSYCFRIIGNGYPEQAPSIACIDPESGSTHVQSAWPQCQGFRPGNQDLCLPLSAEGFVAHPEWRNDAEKKWNPVGNPLLRVLDELQLLLNDPAKYTGRMP